MWGLWNHLHFFRSNASHVHEGMTHAIQNLRFAFFKSSGVIIYIISCMYMAIHWHCLRKFQVILHIVTNKTLSYQSVDLSIADIFCLVIIYIMSTKFIWQTKAWYDITCQSIRSIREISQSESWVAGWEELEASWFSLFVYSSISVPRSEHVPLVLALKTRHPRVPRKNR